MCVCGGGSHEVREFLFHFLLNVCIVFHLGKQRFGSSKISWWRNGEELSQWLTEWVKNVSTKITKQNWEVWRRNRKRFSATSEPNTLKQGSVDLLCQVCQFPCEKEADESPFKKQNKIQKSKRSFFVNCRILSHWIQINICRLPNRRQTGQTIHTELNVTVLHYSLQICNKPSLNILRLFM